MCDRNEGGGSVSQSFCGSMALALAALPSSDHTITRTHLLARVGLNPRDGGEELDDGQGALRGDLFVDKRDEWFR